MSAAEPLNQWSRKGDQKILDDQKITKHDPKKHFLKTVNADSSGEKTQKTRTQSQKAKKGLVYRVSQTGGIISTPIG